MIRNSFCILSGIGEKTERRLWREGVLTWDDFIRTGDIAGINPGRKKYYDDELRTCRDALDAGDARFFSGAMKRREHWRLFDSFRDYAVCLDIETNGLMPESGGYATVIGLYDGYDYKCLIRGENLTTEILNRELARYKCLITFYGAGFDVPFLLRSLRGVAFDLPHFDLCFSGKKLGYNGGLKALEQSLGIERDGAVKGLSGYDAAALWEHAASGSHEARELLLLYNREDTVNLMRIADLFYLRLRQATGIEDYLSCGTA